ncbi:MAG: hypothetical protein HY880_01170 [Deltaproteobacteria bacterium]|nr:hypothetical protein [Deltaproteobacteria bacterium]
MDLAQMKTERLDRMTGEIAVRVIRNNIILGTIGISICLVIGKEAVLGFGAGFLAAMGNLYMLFNTARIAVGMEPERAKGFVARRYPVRFFLTAALIIVLVWKLPAWAVLIAFTFALMTTVITLIFIARAEAVFTPCARGG